MPRSRHRRHAARTAQQSRRPQTPKAVTPLAVRNAASSTSGTVYEAGSQGRRTAGWNAPTASPNGWLGSLTTIRDRSRAAVRNDGYAGNIVDKLVSNIIGTGIKPMSLAEDASFRQALQARWLRWTDESDADGLLDFYGQQAQATRTWVEAGECFARIRPRQASDGLTVPLQIQNIEPELCPHTTTRLQTGNRVKAGIEFSPIGRREGYWFHPSRTSDGDEPDFGVLRRVSAERVIHLFEPLRAGQLRGLPRLTSALVRLHELDKFDDATLLRQQLSNLFVAFLKRPTQDGDAEWINPLTNGSIDEDSTERPLTGLTPGLFQELGPGEEVDFSEPPDVGQTYPDFMRQQLFGACAATGVPYEVVTGDMRGVNDRVIRVVLNEFRRRIQAWQHQVVVHMFCRPIWNAFLDRVFLSGALPMPIAYLENPEPWRRVKWVPQGWQYLHPVQDVQAAEIKIRAGLGSRAASVSELGEDVEVIDAEQAADNARADRLGLKHDSDGRQSKTQASAAPARESEPAPDPEPEGAPA